MKRAALILCAAAAMLAACSSKLTNENLTKVKAGMSEKEVVAILGKPDEVKTSENFGFRGTAYVYRAGKSEVTVAFLNDHVVSKEGTFK